MKVIKVSAIALGIVASAAMVAPASAQWSAGASLGRVNQHYDRSDATAVGVTSSVDDKDSAYKLFGGYRLSDTWGLEFQYANLGKAKNSYATAGSTGSQEVKNTSWGGFFTGNLPMASGFSLTGKVGLALNTSKMTFSGAGPAFLSSDSGKSNKTNVAWGVGAAYSLTPNWALRLEYEEFGKVGKSTNNLTTATATGRSDPTVWSLGLQYKY